jgi:hypothetical protein
MEVIVPCVDDRLETDTLTSSREVGASWSTVLAIAADRNGIRFEAAPSSSPVIEAVRDNGDVANCPFDAEKLLVEHMPRSVHLGTSVTRLESGLRGMWRNAQPGNFCSYALGAGALTLQCDFVSRLLAVKAEDVAHLEHLDTKVQTVNGSKPYSASGFATPTPTSPRNGAQDTFFSSPSRSQSALSQWQSVPLSNSVSSWHSTQSTDLFGQQADTFSRTTGSTTGIIKPSVSTSALTGSWNGQNTGQITPVSEKRLSHRPSRISGQRSLRGF